MSRVGNLERFQCAPGRARRLPFWKLNPALPDFGVFPPGKALALEPERKQRQGWIAGEALEQRYV